MTRKEIEAIDQITSTVYRILRGEKVPPIRLPDDFPENEISQLASYVNSFIGEYNEFADFMFSMARGDLDYDPPKGKLQVIHSFKNLQANLRHLTWVTQQIAQGDFSQRVDFMGDFSLAFNKMVTDLKDAFQRIESQKEELAALSKMKDEFISIAGHDLRSPFNGILGAAEYLLSDDNLTFEQVEMVQIIRDSAEVQLRYINDLLDVMSLETGVVKLNMETISLEKLFEQSVGNHLLMARRKGIDVKTDCGGNDCSSIFIRVDAPKIIQVLNNLLSNAIKFTPRGGRVEIGCGDMGGELVDIHVRDTGMGIPEEEIPHLFTRYHKVHQAGTEGEKGTGLGLVIFKNLVEAHGGSVGVKSRPGEGSDFYFTLPLSREKENSGPAVRGL